MCNMEQCKMEDLKFKRIEHPVYISDSDPDSPIVVKLLKDCPELLERMMELNNGC